MAKAEHAEEIRNLIFRYAETIDAGDVDAYSALFARATFRIGGTSLVFEGAEAVAKAARRGLVWYPEGLCTKHLMANVIVEVADDEQTASARAYGVVLQARPDFPLQVVQTALYRDRFERDDAGWYWVDHESMHDLMGDVSHHHAPPRPRS